MPTVNPYRRRRSRFGLFAMMLVTLLMLGGGLTLTLWALGVPLTFWRHKQAAAKPYLVRIPINVRPIAAYDKVDRTDLLDPKTGWLKFQELPPRTAIGMSISGVSLRGLAVEGKATDVRQHEGQLVFVLDSGEVIPHSQIDELGGALMNVSAIVGRVVKKDKTPGLGFREDNFFPRGTPEGIAGATPPGMRAIILDAGTLKGVHTLPAGARVDLMANVPLDDLSSFDRGHNGRLPGAALVLSSSSSKSNRGGRTEPIMLAQEALVLKPVYQRVEATTSSSLTQGKRVQAVPVYEVALAVHPGDVMPLQSALNKELEVICVAHSMQPSDKPNAPTPIRAEELVAPVTSRSILAYEALTYDYFEDAATRRIRREPVTTEEIERGVITSLGELVGARVRHDIPKGSFVTRADLLHPPRSKSRLTTEFQTSRSNEATYGDEMRFFVQQGEHADNPPRPQGESEADDPRPNIVGETPGIAAWTPADRQAFSIPWSRMYGSEHLEIGDRVDLFVTFELEQVVESETIVEPDGTKRVVERRVTRESKDSWEKTLGERAEPWVAALDAKVIGPVGFPPPAASVRFLGERLYDDRTEVNEAGGPPIVFAVDRRDAAMVSAAIAVKSARLTVLIHPNEEPTGDGGAYFPADRQIAIPVLPQAARALEMITPQSLINPRTRRQEFRTFSQQEIDRLGAITQPMELIGRRLKRDIAQGEYVTLNDLYPTDAVAAPVAAEPLTANTTLSTNNLAPSDSPGLGLATRLLIPQEISARGYISNLASLQGRTLKKDVPAGACITEDALYPIDAVAAPVAAELLGAYSMVSPGDWKRLTSNSNGLVLLAPEEVAKREIIVNPLDLVGRVLKRDKEPDTYFIENDFEPNWTHPGVANGIPQGMRGFVVGEGANSIAGWDSFAQGDRVDILTSSTLRFPSNYIVHGDIEGQVEVDVIAVDTVIVQAAHNGRGVIAVPRDLAPKVQAALADPANLLTCAASGHDSPLASPLSVSPPQAPVSAPEAVDSLEDSTVQSPSTSSYSPLANVKRLEAIVGRSRDVHVFPNAR